MTARNLRAVPPPEDASAFHVVNTATGEALPLAAMVQPLEDQIAGLQRDVRAEHLRYENLKRDKQAEAEAHGLFPKAREVFDYWRVECDHPKAAFSPERFFLILPLLEKYGEALCRRAIDGAAFDPFCTTRKNGTTKRHDGIDLIFRSAEKFEEFANRTPLSPGNPDAAGSGRLAGQ